MMRSAPVTEEEATIEHLQAPLLKATSGHETPQVTNAKPESISSNTNNNPTNITQVQAKETISPKGDSHSASTVSKKSDHVFSPLEESASLTIPELRAIQPDEEFMRMK